MKKYLRPALLSPFAAVVLLLALVAPAFADDIRSQFPDLGGSISGGGGTNSNNFYSGSFNPNSFNPNNFNPSNFNPGASNQNQFAAPNDAGNQALLKRINFDPRKMVRPDKFADNPSTDDSGGRHFANGRHYDLASTSVKAAVEKLNASDDQLYQQAIQRQQIKQNRGRQPF